MKWFLFILIFLAFFTPIVFIGKGVDNLDIMQERYKRALDAGADAAVRYRSYATDEFVSQQASGFGEGTQHTNNVKIERDEALKWFYRVFYRNIGIENNTAAQNEIKKYIPLKALVGFDRVQIADLHDQWVVDSFYEISYKDKVYRFTLSDQVQDIATGEWRRDTDFGIPPDERAVLVNQFVKDKINQFLNSRENIESGHYYDVNITVLDIESKPKYQDANNNTYSDISPKSDDIDGVNFIVMAEGLPLPSMNPFKPGRLYAFGLGGSEIVR